MKVIPDATSAAMAAQNSFSDVNFTSSIGQLSRMLPHIEALRSPSAIAIGCVDHNRARALSGRSVATADECISAVAESWADEELAAAMQRKTIPAADVLRGIARDRIEIRKAPSLTIGGIAVADLTGLPGGTLQWAPDAGCLDGLAYLAVAPSRPGEPPKVVFGGETTKAAVEAFVATATACVTAAGDAEWAIAAKAATPDNGHSGVYGGPTRGFCGAYVPPAILRAALGATTA